MSPIIEILEEIAKLSDEEVMTQRNALKMTKPDLELGLSFCYDRLYCKKLQIDYANIRGVDQARAELAAYRVHHSG